MTIVFYISGHGFGHASRSIELLVELARRTDARLIARTSVASWLFETTAPRRVEVMALDTDVGVVQIDSLNIDERETARRVASFYGSFEQRVDAEAAWLSATGATMVLADIPPLAFAAAARAGVPSVAIANFTWDWIYSAYGFDGDAAVAIDTIRAAYATATRALRLPLHGGFAPMSAVTTDIPFIARRSTREPADTRARLGIPDDRPFVLACFSAGDLALNVDDAEHLTVLSPAREAPASLTYPDLVAAADVVVSKPGYGIVSECVANGTPLLYTSRGRFPEYDVFVDQMPRMVRCRHLPRADFLAGHWRPAIDALLAQPAPPETPRVDGAAIAALAIMNLVNG